MSQSLPIFFLSHLPVSLTSLIVSDQTLEIQQKPMDNLRALPLESNILEWHFVVEGSEGTAYEGGWYHGKVIFPPTYPYKPPSIQMITPSGRFKTNTRLCLSMSDFHPESWNPMWSVSTILMGLVSFMLEESPTTGSISTSDYTKRELAKESLEMNCKDKIFVELFPELVELYKEQKRKNATETVNVNSDDSKLSSASKATSSNGNIPNGDVQLSWAVICAIIAIIVSSFYALIKFSLT